MAHECESCGQSFETLSRLRLHDCQDVQAEGGQADATALGSVSATDAGTRSVAELDALLDRVVDGDSTAVHDAVATFESTLSSALEEDDSGDVFREVFWPYYERVSNVLDEVTRSEGWELLGDIVNAYDPTEDDGVPLATPAVANAVGRYVIRTRLTDGVEAIPVGALEYLDAVAVDAKGVDDVAREEVHAYGWGIGHPDHSVVDRLHERVSEDVFSVDASLEHAFYADQYAAVAALERLVRDDSIDGTLPRHRREDVAHRRYLLDCVYGLKTEGYWPQMPRYWDWHEDADEEYDYAFELDETVEQRIRALVAETGFDSELPDNWTFRDLGI